MWIMIVNRADSLQGTIQVPGDKSISHRAAILSAMAEGETRIENFSTAQDCQTTLKCLADLGVPISRDGTEIVVSGVGKTGFRAPRGPLDCGNSGTTARLLAGVLAGQSFDSVLTEFVGVSATHGPLAGPPNDPPEVQLRVGVRGPDKAKVERFTREIVPLVLNGPPSVTGFAGGKPKVEEIVAYWPALVDKTVVQTQVEVLA